MAEYNEKIKILMLKGEKGDAYDDTELRAEIEAELANNAYVKVISDGAVELPIHTINDNVTGSDSTWSSSKISAMIDDEHAGAHKTFSSNYITDKFTQHVEFILYSNNTALCTKTLDDLKAVIKTTRDRALISAKYNEAPNNRGLLISHKEDNDAFYFVFEIYDTFTSNKASGGDTITVKWNKSTDAITWASEDINAGLTALQNSVNTLTNNLADTAAKSFSYSPYNGIQNIDTTKYNHLLVITTNRLLFIVLGGLNTGTYGFTSLVGNPVTANCAKLGNYLTISFDSAAISSFCYMLTN